MYTCTDYVFKIIQYYIVLTGSCQINAVELGAWARGWARVEVEGGAGAGARVGAGLGRG